MKYNFILAGTILSIFYWITESAIHTYVFDKGSLYENLFALNNMHEIWMRLSIASVIFLFGFFVQNILNRSRKTEQALRASEERYRALFEQAPDSILLIDAKTGKLAGFNNKACENLGYTREEFRSLAVSDFEVIESPSEIESHIKRILNDGADAFDTVHRTKDGRLRNIYVSARALTVGKKTYIQSICSDITDRKEAERALVESERRLDTAQRIAHIGNWEWDITANTLWWSDEIYRIFGLQPREFDATYEAFLEYVHPEDREFIADAVDKALNHKQPYSIDHRIVRPDGSELFVHEFAEVTFNESGTPLFMTGTVQDITDRKKAENMLRSLADISDRTGIEYFQSITAFIAGELGTEYALIGKLDGDRRKVKTIAAFAHGKVIADIEYDLHGTPCDNVMGKKACIYLDNIQRRFPEDKLLVDMKAESYAGIPLFASEGQPLGIIVALGCSPMKENEEEKCISLLQIFSARVSSELERRAAEANIRKNYQAQRVLNSLLHISLEDIPLEKQLEQALDLILSVPFLSLSPQAAVFLVEDNPDMLVMKAQRNLPAPIKDICAEVPVGKCYCGRAAESRQIEFTDCVNHHHDNTFDGITPHGHYNVPILSKDRVQGVLALYLKEGHSRSIKEVEFLQAVANTLAGIIERKQAEENLHHSYNLLDSIKHSQSQFIADTAPYILFNKLLADLTSLTQSEYGFIGEILHTADNEPYLKTHAITDISWNKETKALYEKHAISGMEFSNLKTLFGSVITSGKPLIANNPPIEPGNGRLPEGHPPLNCFLGLPIYKVDTLVGMVGLANRPGGYSEKLIKYLHPLLSTCGTIIEESRNNSRRRQAEEELKQKAAFVMNNPAPVLQVNKKGNVTYCNPAAIETFHTDPTGKNCSNLFPSLRNFNLEEVLPDSPKQFDEKVGVEAFLFTIKKDRTTDSYYIYGSNITEHKELESRLLHVQKMESIGTLAGGVAHDFNNIITAIIGFVSVINRRMPEDDPLLVYVNQIQKAAENAANLTSSLLTFSRKQKMNPLILDFNEVISKMGKFLLRIIGEDIEFRTSLSDYPLNVRVDFNQMEQVLMNLAANARDAMPGGGILTVSTEITEIDISFIKSHGYGDPGTYAVIEVSDTGTGIDEKIKEKIFEPFFTTKEVDKGTGLGLSIVYGIIKQHNGYISVSSKPGKGTHFRIYLPMVKKTIEDTSEKQTAESRSLAGSETVLLAEDDVMIRGIIESELTEFGYTVITAEDGEDAVNKFLEHRQAVQMFITDVVMPRQSGKDAYEEIRKVRPDMKVLFLSGYSEELMNEINDTGSNRALMSKPVKPEKLLQRIREMLDSKG